MIKITGHFLFSLITGFFLLSQSYAYDLGGKCMTSDDPSARRYVSTKETGNYETDLENHKLFIRQMCKNKYRWYGLISFLLKHDKTKEAIEVFDEFFNRGLNTEPKDFALGDKNDIVRLMQSEDFKRSKGGKFLQSREGLSINRKAEALAKIKKMPADDRPPSFYIKKDACPFECCTYRQWTVVSETELYDKPNGQRLKVRVHKGDTVQGVTGEVHLEPAPLVVVHEKPSDDFLTNLPVQFLKKKNIADPLKFRFNKGEILFLLDYTGEGYYNFFYEGVIADAPLAPHETCTTPGTNCWLEYVIPAPERKKPVWWFKIRLNDGTEGWSNEPDNFGNKDACG